MNKKLLSVTLLAVIFFASIPEAYATTFGIDGNAVAANSPNNLFVGCRNTSTNTCTATPVTTNPNDIIILQTDQKSTLTVTSVTSVPALTWKERKSLTWVGVRNTENVTEWSAFWTSSGSLNITATYSGARVNPLNMIAFGWSGADTVNFFDSNSRALNTNSGAGSGSTATVTTSTTNPNVALIGLEGADTLSAAIQCNAGTGFTRVNTGATISAGGSCAEYQVVSSAQTNVAIKFGTISSGSNGWGIIGDAIIQAPVTVIDERTPALLILVIFIVAFAVIVRRKR